MKQSIKDELIASCALLLLALSIGMGIGYWMRAVSTRDRFVLSQAHKMAAEADFYDRQMNQIKIIGKRAR